uniref:NADH dehydrogenase subunit 6 n=1 Tax=Duthiersia expansa TaxID=2015383 RepID=A0A8F7CDM2_9CEST|nr:NADH dehydrogenase subunit 6 [Duthiersia expansa]
MLLSFSLFGYFCSLCLFALINHPVFYCLLLILNALFCCFVCYSIFGFSWYALLFCLVYVGGIYILFIFVSVHSPNSSSIPYWSSGFISVSLFSVLTVLVGWFLFVTPVHYESSNFLCSLNEGYFYVCMCLTLLFGFIVLSFVLSVKNNYYR